MRNILTVDLEDWYMELPARRRGALKERVEADTQKVLELLACPDAASGGAGRATFFVLGCIAQRHPKLIRDIARAGHEIALHGLRHEMLTEKSPPTFARELRECKDIVEQAAGVQVKGFRAPYFSVVRRTLWALPIIASCGIEYDSSIFPTWHFRYGIPGWQPFPHRVNLTQLRVPARHSDAGGPVADNAPQSPTLQAPSLNLRLSREGGSYGDGAARDARQFVEIPISTVRLGGLRVPFSGGGYLRMLPYPVVSHCIRALNALGHPAIVYFHPWELDPDQPHLWGPAGFRLRHYVGLKGLRDKLKRLLSEFEFTTAGEFATGLAGVA